MTSLQAPKPRPRRRPPFALIALGCCLPWLGGCLDTLLESIFAPQQVAANGISGGANAVSSSVPNSLPAGVTPIPDNDQTVGAVEDLQRIMNENPDAANRPELMALQQQLQNSPVMLRRPNSVLDEPDRKAEWDHRVRAPKSFPADDIGIDYPPHVRRAGQEWALPTAPGELMTLAPDPVYQLSLDPVRLQEKPANGGW